MAEFIYDFFRIIALLIDLNWVDFFYRAWGEG